MISTFSRTQNFANGLMSLHKVTLTRCPLDANEGNVLPARRHSMFDSPQCSSRATCVWITMVVFSPRTWVFQASSTYVLYFIELENAISTFSRNQNFTNGLIPLHAVAPNCCPLDANKVNVFQRIIT